MITVLIVDDQHLVRSGFTAILGSQDDISVVGEAANGVEAVQLTSELSPDIICMDIEMPVMNGIEATKRIREQHSNTKDEDRAVPKILILTTFGQESYVRDAITLGVDGFLLKTCGVDELIGAVRRIAHGGSVLGSEATRIVMQAIARDGHGFSEGRGCASDKPDPPQSATRNSRQVDMGTYSLKSALKIQGITDRETEVLLLLASGCSNGEIAAQLFLGESTVKTYVSNLLAKLHARDRIQLIIWAYNHGFSQRSEE